MRARRYLGQRRKLGLDKIRHCRGSIFPSLCFATCRAQSEHFSKLLLILAMHSHSLI